MPEQLSPIKLGPITIGPALAYVMLVTTVLGWASGLVVGRGIHETIPPIGASFWRWTIVAICLIPLAAPKLKSELPLILSAWKQLAAMGFFMIGASTISLVAVNFTTATNASLVNATQPTTTVLAAWLVLKIKLSKIQTAGIIAAAIGILIMISRADFQVLANLEFNKGDLIFGVAVLHRRIDHLDARYLQLESRNSVADPLGHDFVNTGLFVECGQPSGGCKPVGNFR